MMVVYRDAIPPPSPKADSSFLFVTSLGELLQYPGCAETQVAEVELDDERQEERCQRQRG